MSETKPLASKCHQQGHWPQKALNKSIGLVKRPSTQQGHWPQKAIKNAIGLKKALKNVTGLKRRSLQYLSLLILICKLVVAIFLHQARRMRLPAARSWDLQAIIRMAGDSDWQVIGR